jgi:hypothetical protein
VERDVRFGEIETALKRAVSALRDAGVPFLLGGSLASWARGGPETRHDLDLMVRPEDADRALEALARAGMRTDRPPEDWLYKAWDGAVLIDVIFAPRGLEMRDEVLARGERLHVLGIDVPVMALEDVLTTRLLALDEHDLDYTVPLRIARALREQIDWAELRARTRFSPYARAFFALLEELGIAGAADAPRASVRDIGRAEP